MRFERLHREEPTALFSVTALVDVLFLMIIFLVLGANFDSVDTVRLPESGLGKPSETTGILRVVLRTDGSLWTEGTRLGTTGSETATTPAGVAADQLESVIQVLKARSLRGVVLLPDETVAVGVLFRLHERLQEALGVPVQVGVRRPAGGPAAGSVR